MQKGLNMNRNYIGKRVRIVGDHPHKGQTGKVVSIERTLAGDGYKIELDDKSTASACFVFSMLEMMLLNERG